MGLAKEVTQGTPVAATNFAPVTSATIMAEPGLFFPQTMHGTRDVNVFGLYGQEKVAGAINAPLFPVNGIPLFIGAVGTDNGQTGTASGAKVGTVAAAVVSATSLTYTVSSGGAPVNGDIFQIGSATLGAAGLLAGSQVVLVTNVSGGGPYTLTVAALSYKVDTTGNGGAGLNAKSVAAPYFHNIVEANTLPSFTIEKNLGNYQSEQYAGCLVNKFDLKLPTSNAEATFTADMIGQTVAIMDTPTGITVDSAVPWVFSEGALDLWGNTSLVQVTNVELSLENTVKDNYTLGQHTAKYVNATSRKITGKMTLVFTSLDDADWGFFKQALPTLATSGTPTQNSMALTLTHPGTGGIMKVTLPQVNLSKITDEIKIGDLILQSLDFTASYQLSSSTSLTAYVGNSQRTPY